MNPTDDEKLNWLENAIIQSYKELKSQFDNETHSEVILKITKFGFKNYVEDAVVQFIKNLHPEYFDMFSDNLLDGLDTDSQTKQWIGNNLKMVPYYHGSE